MYEYKTGTNFQHGDMKPEVWAKSYPVLLRKAGYLTAFAGKFGMEVEGRGLCKEDFDYWGGSAGQTSFKTKENPSMAKYAEKFPHATLSYSAFSEDVIRDCAAQEKPFCLSISFKAPHRPVEPDPKFNHVYAGKTFTKPANYGRAAGEHMAPQSKLGRQYPRFQQWDYDKNYDEVMAKYFTQVYAIDQALGMIRETLQNHQIADNTVIIYTSDNGFICGSHGYGSKVLPMEESSRVPLIIFDPRQPESTRGKRSSALTANIDFAPTLLELAGLPTPENMDGKSLSPLLEDSAQSHHQQIAFLTSYGPIGGRALTTITSEWKYTYWWYGTEKFEPTEELFHLAEDPLEMNNLAQNSSQANALEEMRQRYDQEFTKLKNNAVTYNGYQKYRQLFDRNIPWQKKTAEDQKKPKK